MKKRSFIPLVIAITLILVVFIFISAREETFLSPALRYVKKVSNLGASEGKVYKYCNSDMECGSNQKCFRNSCRNQLCADSDGGRETEIFGQVTISIEGVPSGGSVYIDECAGNSQLKEFRCDGVNPASELVDCYEGCRNGACIPDKIFMTFSTEKDKYNIGEQVLLTASDSSETRGNAEEELIYVAPERESRTEKGEATTGDTSREVIAPVTQEEITTRTQGLAQVKQNIASGNLRWKAGVTSNIYKSKAEIEKIISPAPEEMPVENNEVEWNTDCMECDEDSDCPTDRYCVYETIRHPVGCCSEKMPDYFDWRNRHGKNYVTSVKKSSDECIESSAWTVLGALEAKINMFYNNPDIDRDFSEMDPIVCGGVGDCFDNVYTGRPQAFLNYMQYYKLALESDLPMWMNDFPECGDKPADWLTRAWGITSWEEICDYVCDPAHDYSNPISIQHIKKTIIEKGPVVASFRVFEEFYYYYEEGIYASTQPYGLLGNIPVLIVGWGKSDGVEYWIVKNIWSKEWGEGGYFRIKMRDPITHIDEWALEAIDSPIPPSPQQEICTDADSDGYCAWGWGNWGGKPTTGCPACSDVPDCDDSKPEVYENCDIISGEKAAIRVSVYKNGEPYLGEAAISINDYFVDKFNYMGSVNGDWIYLNDIDEGWRSFRATAVSEDGETEYIGFAVAEVGVQSEIIIEITEAPVITAPTTYRLMRVYPEQRYFQFHLYTLGEPLSVAWTYGEPVEDFKVEWGFGGQESEDGLLFAETYSEEGVSYGETPGSATIDTSNLKRPGIYTIKLTTYYPGDISGAGVEKKILVFIDNLKEGWPKLLSGSNYNVEVFPITTADISGDLDKEIIVRESERITIFNYLGQKINEFGIEGCSRLLDYGPDYLVPPPLVGDIDGDGQNEIVLDGNIDYDCSYGLYAWEGDGTPVANFPISHAQLGIVSGSGETDLHLMDINHDGAMEIIMESGSTLKAISGNGEIFSEEGYNWPIVLPVTISATESNVGIGDVDVDGNDEIVVQSLEGMNSVIAIYSARGEIEAFLDNCPIQHGFKLVDLDGDKDLEIISQPPAIICHHTGEIMKQTAYPEYYVDFVTSVGMVDSENAGMALVNHLLDFNNLQLYDNSGTYAWGIDRWKYGEGNLAQPVMADVNGDGKVEIFIKTYDRTYPPYEHPFQSKSVWGIDSSGKFLEGFKLFDYHEGQKILYGFSDVFSTNLVIDDLDRDGKFEMIATDNYGVVYVWEIPGYYRTPVYGWPTYMQNLAQTGSLEDKMELAPKSQIKNKKKTDVNGIINMKVQRKSGGGWTDVESVISNAELFVPANNKVSLSDLWQMINPWTAQEPGRYRIHGEFRFDQRLLDYDYEFDVVASQLECGDGEVDYGEFCDGQIDCTNIQGYNGVQNCEPDCTAFTECILQESCGDSIINGDEVCDGSDLAGQSCTDFGWVSPEGLACKSDCMDFDISGCGGGGMESCGNGVIEPGETCDGTNLNGQTCESVGWSGGTLGCYPSDSERMCTFDASQCTGCGSGTENPDGSCSQTFVVLSQDGNSDNYLGSNDALPSFLDVATGVIGAKSQNLISSTLSVKSESNDNPAGTKFARATRGYLPFDTSAIPEGAYLRNADVLLFSYSSSQSPSGVSHPWVVITDVNPANVLVPDSTDLFMSYENIEGSNRINIADLQTLYTPAVFTLNSEGLKWIDDTGYSTLGIRTGPELMLDNGGLATFYVSQLFIPNNAGRPPEKWPRLNVTYSRAQM